MADSAYLVAVRDTRGALTGYSRCTLCDAEFGSRPHNPNELAIIFAGHFSNVHGDGRTKIESVSETAARVVEEAIRKLPKKPSKRKWDSIES